MVASSAGSRPAAAAPMAAWARSRLVQPPPERAYCASSESARLSRYPAYDARCAEVSDGSTRSRDDVATAYCAVGISQLVVVGKPPKSSGTYLLVVLARGRPSAPKDMVY